MSSRISDCRTIVSSSLSSPLPVLAETSTSSVSPPIDSTIHLVLQQVGPDLLRIGIGLVDLVDGNDDRNAGRLGVLDRFDRLRHHGVVGRHHQDGDVGRLGAAGTHGGEGFVAGRVEEGDLLAVPIDLVGADMLGDAAGFAGRRHWRGGWRRAARSCRGRHGP